MNKQTQIKLAKIFVYTDLLISEIDNKDLTPTPETKRIHDKAVELQQLLEPVLERFYSQNVRQTTFFSTICQKIEFIFKKEYKY